MAGELSIEVGNLFSLWQDLDPWWPLDYYHNWLFNFSHCFSIALWTIHSPSQPPQNMVGMMFGAVFQEGRKKSSAFLWYRNYLPDQCPNRSYSIEERRGVLYWCFFGCLLQRCFMLWHERSSGLQIQFQQLAKVPSQMWSCKSNLSAKAVVQQVMAQTQRSGVIHMFVAHKDLDLATIRRSNFSCIHNRKTNCLIQLMEG